MGMNNRRIYQSEAFNYITGMASDIDSIAGMLGLTPEIIAGALAEEADSYYSLPVYKRVANDLLDYFAVQQSHDVLKEDYTAVMDAGIIDDKNHGHTYEYYSKITGVGYRKITGVGTNK